MIRRTIYLGFGPYDRNVGVLNIQPIVPLAGGSQACYFAARPDGGPDWQLRLQVQVLLPLPGG